MLIVKEGEKNPQGRLWGRRLQEWKKMVSSLTYKGETGSRQGGKKARNVHFRGWKRGRVVSAEGLRTTKFQEKRGLQKGRDGVWVKMGIWDARPSRSRRERGKKKGTQKLLACCNSVIGGSKTKFQI